MPRVILTATAVADIERCRQFLLAQDTHAATAAIQEIRRHLRYLQDMPEIGRPLREIEAGRELLIPFGTTGYVALYRYHSEEDQVVILAFRHQKEAGY